jgi:hypothetical protein
MKESRKPHERVETEIAVLREIASAVARERNVRRLLEDALGILERSMGMLRGTFTLLEGDELRIVASTSGLNAEERALGRYHIGVLRSKLRAVRPVCLVSVVLLWVVAGGNIDACDRARLSHRK